MIFAGKRGSLALIVAVVQMMCGAATAGTYYVAGSQTNSSDSNPGTLAQPWKTIVHAAKAARAGDTVYVRAGTYTGQVVVANSGEPGKEIVLRAYPGDERKAVINGAGITVKGHDRQLGTLDIELELLPTALRGATLAVVRAS